MLPLGQGAWVVHLTVDSEADAVAPATIVVRTPEASEASVEVFLPGPALGLIGVPSAGDQMVLPGGIVPLAVDPDVAFQVVLDGEPDAGDGADGGAPSQLVRDADGADHRPPAPGGRRRRAPPIAVAVRFPDGTFAADSRVFEVGTLQG